MPGPARGGAVEGVAAWRPARQVDGRQLVIARSRPDASHARRVPRGGQPVVDLPTWALYPAN